MKEKELIKNFKITSGFFNRYEALIKDTVIPYQEKALRDEIEGADKSHAIENFILAADYLKTGKKPGDFFGMVFQDSDVAKWLEAVAYSLIMFPDKELEARADEVIEIVKSAQQADGYLNTYFTLNDDKKHFSNLCEAHELYCAGHMMEAAVAYYDATGKDTLLNVMLKMTDCIYDYFITNKNEGYPGHPEVELALMRMYHTTGNEKCLTLAKHFIDVRGVDPKFFEKEYEKNKWVVWGADHTNHLYAQNHAPVREQTDAVGHAVRAVYLYTAMADLANQTNDESLKKACETLWKSIVNKRMYVTGGIGSTVLGEAFTEDYHLPNDTAYCETCASIGLIFFARKMLELNKNSIYSEVMEKALYNTVLAGMQLDGKRFFYVNMLEVDPSVSDVAPTHKHTLPMRPKWFACACCPPNVARLLPSIAKYAWTIEESAIYSHLFIAGSLPLTDMTVNIDSDYPYDGNIKYTFTNINGSVRKTFAVRIPMWSRNTTVCLNGKAIFTLSSDGKHVDIKEDGSKYKEGYLYIDREFSDNDEITLCTDMTPYRIYSNYLVGANNGMVAIGRGPLIYCAEGVDNKDDLYSLAVSALSDIKVEEYDANTLFGITKLTVSGTSKESSDVLYSTVRPKRKDVDISLIPYYAWGNRKLNKMRVWLPEE